MSYHALTYWVRKLRQEPDTPARLALVEVPFRPSPLVPRSSPPFRLHLGYNRLLEIESDFDEASLGRLLGFLEQRCQMLFGRSSERLASGANSVQLPLFDLPEPEHIEPAKVRIGEEVSEQLDIVLARIQVLRHVRPKYACRRCEGVEDEGPSVRVAPMSPQIIPQSIVSPGLHRQVH